MVVVVMVAAWPWVSMAKVYGFCFLYGFLGFGGHEFVVRVSRKQHCGWVYIEEAFMFA